MTEALWTIGPAGTLAAYDGWTSQPATRIEVGLPEDQWPSLLAGGGRLWVCTSGGELAIIDPVAGRVLIRLTVPTARMPGLVATSHAHGALWFARAGELGRVSGAGELTVTELPDGFGVDTVLAPAVAATSEWLWLASGEITLSARLPGVYLDSLAASPLGLVATAVNRPDVFVDRKSVV